MGGSVSLRLFRVKFGLCLVQGTLLTIILILMAGDVSRNPGPTNISTAERNFSAEIKNYLNISQFIIQEPLLNQRRVTILKFPLLMNNTKVPAEI